MKDAAANRRTDIQGLRAIAVSLVVLDHVFGFPHGGFIGVDVFFVISGFLITGLILRELEATGSLSFRAFYARRVRRIVPAAAAALLFTVVVSALLWYPLRAIQVAQDAFWAIAFMSNWHFQAAGSDYFASGLARSPILHYWSLSIEEQFYALWPPILLLACLAFRRFRQAILVLILAGFALSLSRAVWVTGTDGAYFDSFGRAWELLLGGLIASVGVAGPHVPMLVRKMAQYLGLILIFGTAFLVKPDWSLPYPWVGPAVLGASLIIWSDVPTGQASILGNRLSQWLGDISYSLYVWHFPIIIFAMTALGQSWLVKLSALAVMLGVANTSRRWIEQPFLDGSWLARAAQIKNTKPWVWRDAAVAGIVLAVLGGLLLLRDKGPAVFHASASVLSRLPALVEPQVPDTSEARVTSIESALESYQWPSSLNAPGSWRMALNQGKIQCVNSVRQRPLPQPRWCVTLPMHSGF